MLVLRATLVRVKRGMRDVPTTTLQGLHGLGMDPLHGVLTCPTRWGLLLFLAAARGWPRAGKFGTNRGSCDATRRARPRCHTAGRELCNWHVSVLTRLSCSSRPAARPDGPPLRGRLQRWVRVSVGRASPSGAAARGAPSRRVCLCRLYSVFFTCLSVQR